MTLSNGLEVFLPWMPPDPDDEGDVSGYRLLLTELIISPQHADVVLLHWLARGKDATAPCSATMDGLPMVSLVECPGLFAPTEEHLKHEEEKRAILSRGRAVAILTGAKQDFTWNEYSLLRMTDRTADVFFEWQCRWYIVAYPTPSTLTSRRQRHSPPRNSRD